jgi:Holliday junction resolvase-like predicted endonuclease
MELIIKAQSSRITELGKLGEEFAMEALKRNGFQQVSNLNESKHNHPFADVVAEKQGTRYFISVKARNEKQRNGKNNDSYNCIKIAETNSNILKSRGKTKEEITLLALEQVRKLAKGFDAIPAWITVPIRPEEGTFAVYFGLLEDLGVRRSIPMTQDARENYQCFVDWKLDKRITPKLKN